jgi:cell division protein FtsB
VSFRSTWWEALRWPGQVDGAAEWEGDGERGVDRRGDEPRDDSELRPSERGVDEARRVRLRWPGQADASARGGADQEPVAPSRGDGARQRRLGVPAVRLRMPRVGIPSIRRPRVGGIRALVAAVYGALAEPLVGGDAEARARRAAMVRRASRTAVAVALAAVLIYAIFPVRTYLDQRAATDRARTQIEVLTEENRRLEELRERLQDEEEVIRIARRDYGLIFPGEDAYGILPAPEDTDDNGDEGIGDDTGEDTTTTAP